MPKVGENLIITLQLYDGLASMPKRVFVDLSAPNGTLLFPRFEILHVINGDFRDDTHLMPDLSYVTAQYFVYEPDGTTLDEDYIINKDVFMKATCELSSTVIEGSAIVGEIQEDSGLLGSIDGIALEGTILISESLSGTIDDSSLEGEIANEC